MTKSRIFLSAILALTLFASIGVSASLTDSLKPGKADLKSAGSLAFGPDGVLFVGDSIGGAIFAIDTQDSAVAQGAAINITGANEKIAALLGTMPDQIQLNDVAVNPASKKAYVSVSRGRGVDATPVIVRIDGTGKMDVLSLANVKYARAVLPNPASAAQQNQRLQTITDLAFVNNSVYVAGLTNEEFSSNMRTIPFPFAEAGRGASVEIWHGSHARFETNSPIRTFVPYKIKNEDYIIAAYTCTPLVKLPVAALKPGSKVEGVTIAEMGAGNRPLDMIIYVKDGKNYILMANSSHGVTKMLADGLGAYPAITKSVSDKAGEPYQTIVGLRNIVQLDALDAQRALLLEQNGSAMNLKTVALP